MIRCIDSTNGRNLRILDVKEVKAVPYVPLSHQRLIGTIRRECLDLTLFWTAADLETKLLDFQRFYNAARSHASLDGRMPLTFTDNRQVAPADLSWVRWVSYCHDLVQLPIAA
jgi:hypothetical protein